MPLIGFWEILLILVIVLIIFGPKKLPELARSLGVSIKEFKKAMEKDDKPKKTSKSKNRAG